MENKNIFLRNSSGRKKYKTCVFSVYCRTTNCGITEYKVFKSTRKYQSLMYLLKHNERVKQIIWLIRLGFME